MHLLSPIINEPSNAAREGARFGATQPTNDLGLAQPPSVNAVRYLVDSYLQTAHINDCGLNSDSTTTWALAGVNLDWHFTATANGCTMTMDVIREVLVQITIGGATVITLFTAVQISHPYQWHFNNVIQLLVLYIKPASLQSPAGVSLVEQLAKRRSKR
jgi:hypothetical protein